VVDSQDFSGGMADATSGMGGTLDGGIAGNQAWQASGPATVRLVFAGDDGAAATSSLDLDVERYAGCYFVSFA
jgi:hypothetical protein